MKIIIKIIIKMFISDLYLTSNLMILRISIPQYLFDDPLVLRVFGDLMSNELPAIFEEKKFLKSSWCRPLPCRDRTALGRPKPARFRTLRTRSFLWSASPSRWSSCPLLLLGPFPCPRSAPAHSSRSLSCFQGELPSSRSRKSRHWTCCQRTASPSQFQQWASKA